MKNWMSMGAAASVVACAGFLAGCTNETAPAPGTGTSTEAKGAEPGGTAPAAAKRPETKGAGVKVDGDTIRIGLVASLNGDQKAWGEDSQTGARLVEDEINAAGGIKGKKVKILVQDTQSTPEGGKSAAAKLVADGVVAIIGEVASGITAQVVEVAHEKGIPVVSIGSTRTDLSDKSNCFFRVCYVDDFQGPVMAKFAYDGLKLKKVALMTDQKLPYSTGLSESFSKTFKKLGGEIVDEQKYESGQAQFSGLVEQIKGKNPDGIFCSGYFTEVGPIAKAIRGAGMTSVKLLGGDGWDSPTLVTSGGDAILGGYFCNHYSNFDTRPEVQDFLKRSSLVYYSKRKVKGISRLMETLTRQEQLPLHSRSIKIRLS
jgi:branched-chain amino acid transport system substrate-binding protein